MYRATTVGLVIVLLIGGGIAWADADGEETRASPGPDALEVENPDLAGDPPIQRVNDRPAVPAGAVGYLVDVNLYYRQFRQQLPVGAPVRQEHKVYSIFVPFERPDPRGIEIGRVMPPPVAVDIGSMVCEIDRLQGGLLRIHAHWKAGPNENRSLLEHAWPMTVHPALAVRQPDVLDVLDGNLIYLRDPQIPAELQVFLRLTPYEDGKPAQARRPIEIEPQPGPEADAPDGFDPARPVEHSVESIENPD